MHGFGEVGGLKRGQVIEVTLYVRTYTTCIYNSHFGMTYLLSSDKTTFSF